MVQWFKSSWPQSSLTAGKHPGQEAEHPGSLVFRPGSTHGSERVPGERCHVKGAPGAGDGQGGLVCCGPWGHKELDMTE